MFAVNHPVTLGRGGQGPGLQGLHVSMLKNGEMPRGDRVGQRMNPNDLSVEKASFEIYLFHR